MAKIDDVQKPIGDGRTSISRQKSPFSEDFHKSEEMARLREVSGESRDGSKSLLNEARISSKSRKAVVHEEFQDEEFKYVKKDNAMFANAKDMKDKIRESMIKPQYDVAVFYWDTGFCQMVARADLFQNTTLGVIAFNALWMSVDTDLNKSTTLLEAHPVFQTAEHFFCGYFTFEWTMRFLAFKRKRDGLRDSWFCFDTFMVFMMVAETWVLTIVMLSMSGGGSSSGGMGNASILRLLRLLRLSRMARMAKLLRSMPELLILIKGMVSAMRSVFFTLLLLFMLLYVFAIAFRQLTDGTKVGDKYFPTCPAAMHTLLRDGTFLDSLGNVVSDMLDEGGMGLAFAIIFYIFVFLAAATVMNMLIGVLCEVVSAVAATEKEAITVGMVKDGFLDILNGEDGLDEDGDGVISRKEFMGLLHNKKAMLLLDSVSVDVFGLVELGDFIFPIDDAGTEKELEFGDFMELILSLRGSNNATVKDIVDLRKFIDGSLTKMEENFESQSRKSPQSSRGPSLMMTGDSSQMKKMAAFSNGSPDEGRSPRREASSKSFGNNWDAKPSNANHSLWMTGARMEGLLLAAAADLDRFATSLPTDSPQVGILERTCSDGKPLDVAIDLPGSLICQDESDLDIAVQSPTVGSKILKPTPPAMPPPAVAAPPAGMSGGTGSPRNTWGNNQARLTDETRQRLEDFHLGEFADTISAELGVHALEDLAYLRAEDVSSCSLRPVQRRRLLGLIDSASGSTTGSSASKNMSNGAVVSPWDLLDVSPFSRASRAHISAVQRVHSDSGETSGDSDSPRRIKSSKSRESRSGSPRRVSVGNPSNISAQNLPLKQRLEMLAKVMSVAANDIQNARDNQHGAAGNPPLSQLSFCEARATSKKPYQIS